MNGTAHGLDLSRRLFEVRGRPLLERLSLLDCCAVACVGGTSQNARVDDERSQDHNWGPYLLFVLPDDEFEEHHKQLEDSVASMPDEVDGFRWIGYDGPEPRKTSVRRASDLLRQVTCLSRPLESEEDWMGVVGRNGFLGRRWTELLFDARQGAVFHGDWFERSWREWTRFVPESIKIALVSRATFRIWNAGSEYNLGRLISRGDQVGSRLSVVRVMNDVMELGFTLSDEFTPAYKWRWRHFKELSVFTADLIDRVERLSTAVDPGAMTSLARGIELEIKSVLREMYRPSCSGDAPLSVYAYAIRKQIKSERVKTWADLDWGIDLDVG